jgi:hypothetical protein
MNSATADNAGSKSANQKKQAGLYFISRCHAAPHMILPCRSPQNELWSIAQPETHSLLLK